MSTIHPQFLQFIQYLISRLNSICEVRENWMHEKIYSVLQCCQCWATWAIYQVNEQSHMMTKYALLVPERRLRSCEWRCRLSTKQCQSSRKVLVLEEVLVLGPQVLIVQSLDHKVLKNFPNLRILQTICHVTSINSVTATVHEYTMKNVLLIDVKIRYTDKCQQVSILFCIPVLLSSRKSLSLSSSHKSLNTILDVSKFPEISQLNLTQTSDNLELLLILYY